MGRADGPGRGGHGSQAAGLYYAKGTRGLAQPAVKCRGREYLRIIYGPEYTAAGNLERVCAARGLAGKRSLALREFALGIEGLERFVRIGSRCAVSTNASSACWRWKVSRSTRVCDFTVFIFDVQQG